jgi:hypothetical protein
LFDPSGGIEGIKSLAEDRLVAKIHHQNLPGVPMFRTLFEVKPSWLAAAFVIGLLSAVPAAAQPSNQKPAVGHIIGSIDGVSRDGEQSFISGWACQQGQKGSILVHVFAADSLGSASKRTFLGFGKANLESEAAIGQACQDGGAGKHRFFVSLPSGHGGEPTFFVHGIRIVDGVTNDAISGSGTALKHLAGVSLPDVALPGPAGNYHSLAEHPRVFATAAELKEMAARINRPGSYSMQRFGLLAKQIARDLAARNDWDATYAGCNYGGYLYAFSYEPQDGHNAETHDLLKLPAGTLAPAGAAVVASRLALYAALIKAGAVTPAGAPSADQAAGLAKRILLAWADRGFRDASGRFRQPSGTCDESGKVAVGNASGIPLVLGRGVVYSVQAQDLLQFTDTISAAEASRLNAFHGALFELIRQSFNVRFGQPYPLCERYSDHAANGLAGLVAIARLLDDERRFNAVLLGKDPTIPVVEPWTKFFDHAIYGENERAIDCYDNPGRDSLTSHPSFDTPTTAPGEIEDRYRNKGPGQGIGYPMFTLERLVNVAEILRVAGFDAYGYRGRHRQSIESAIGYYACFGKGADFGKIVTAENSGSCPNAPQYYGKVVNGVDQLATFGAYRFPNNASITDVETSAKAASSTGGFSTDALLFGKWRD